MEILLGIGSRICEMAGGDSFEYSQYCFLQDRHLGPTSISTRKLRNTFDKNIHPFHPPLPVTPNWFVK